MPMEEVDETGPNPQLQKIARRLKRLESTSVKILAMLEQLIKQQANTASAASVSTVTTVKPEFKVELLCIFSQ